MDAKEEAVVQPVLPELNKEKIAQFKKELTHLINCHCIENISDTPDFILADYMVESMLVYGKTMNWRDTWYGMESSSDKETS